MLMWRHCNEQTILYIFPIRSLQVGDDICFIQGFWAQHVSIFGRYTVNPEKYAHGFVVLCFVVVMQSFIMNSHEVFIHIHQGCFAGTGAIVRLPQCQWSEPDGYGKISQCVTTTKHSKAKTVCIFLGMYCTFMFLIDDVQCGWHIVNTIWLLGSSQSLAD